MWTRNETKENHFSERDEILEKYFREVRKIPMLSRVEERELLKRAHEGDQMAVEKLTRANLKFVIRIARQYKHFGIPLNDLINEGNIGLMKAIKHYDFSKDTRLITYAVWWIRQNILKAVSSESSIINLPQNKYWEFLKLRKKVDQFEQENHRQPSIEEVSDLSGLDTDEVKDYFKSGRTVNDHDSYYDQEGNEIPVDDGSIVSENHITEELQEESLSKTIQVVMNCLRDEEKHVLFLSFGIGQSTTYTIGEIAGKLGLSKSKARRLKESAVRKLRHSDINEELREYLCA